MASLLSIIVKSNKVKGMQIIDIQERTVDRHKDNEIYSQTQWIVNVVPYKRLQCLCPECKKVCAKYDKGKTVRWRGLNLMGAPLYFEYAPRRVQCPEHGVHVEFIPWQDGNSHFLAPFNDEVTYLTMKTSKTVVSEFMDINWRTVANCVTATKARLEPDVSERLHSGFTRICVDETSRKRGHTYMTVVIDMDRGTVIWLHEGHGDSVFAQFCEALTEEERAKITLVCGDGARWIGRQTKNYFPNAIRCIDPFHVVTWATDALDEVRRSLSAKARREFTQEMQKAIDEADAERRAWLAEYDKYQAYKTELAKCPVHRGRPSKHVVEMRAFVAAFEEQYGETMDILRKQKPGQLTPEVKAHLAELEAKARNIKGCRYALGMAPENLKKYNEDRLELIKVTNEDLYAAYELKEQLRVIVHMKDRAIAEEAIYQWIKDARASGFKPFVELADKLEKGSDKDDSDPRIEGILNAIEYNGNSALSEGTNSRIKKLIHMANGFRDIEAMFSLIYLVCSDLDVTLPNRYTRPASIKAKKQREANDRRRKLQEAKANAKQKIKEEA